MSTNEWDRLIANKVSRVSYEYDAGDWEKLSLQLAAARRQKRTMLFACRASGIAASLAILLIGIAAMLSKKELPARSYVSGPALPAPAALPPSVNRGTPGQLPGIRHSGRHSVPDVIAATEQTQRLPDTAIYQAPVFAGNDQPVNTPMPFAERHSDTFASERKSHRYDPEQPAPLQYIAATENKPAQRSIGISVTGGVNYGAINTGYAIGAAADKRLSSKLGIEVTVAYVGNIAPGSRYPSSPSNGTGGYLPVTGPSPGPVAAAPLRYLQFSPVAGYSLSQKITVSAGADLQRLLQDQSVTVLYKDNTKVAPLIDLGMLLRTEYTVSPSLRAGLSYRFGANNIIAPGNNYLDRSYLQLQLKYKLH